MFKHGIKNIVIQVLVDEEILDPSALSSVLVSQLFYSFENLKSSDRFSWKK